MIWYNNPLLKTSLQMILKKSNQRIIQLAATYGNRSATFNNYAALLEKGPLQDYVKVRQHVTQRGVDLGTIKVLDIRKLFKAVETGRIDRNQLNEVLAKVSGVHVDQNGNLDKAAMSKGIPTISEIRKQTKKRLINMGVDPREMDNAELDERTELYFDFSTNFQTSYNEAIKAVGESKLRRNDVTKNLWKPGRKSYDELVEIKKWLDTYRKEAASNAKKLEDGT